MGERCEERDFRGDHKRGVQDSEDLARRMIWGEAGGVGGERYTLHSSVLSRAAPTASACLADRKDWSVRLAWPGAEGQQGDARGSSQLSLCLLRESIESSHLPEFLRRLTQQLGMISVGHFLPKPQPPPKKRRQTLCKGMRGIAAATFSWNRVLFPRTALDAHYRKTV